MKTQSFLFSLVLALFAGIPVVMLVAAVLDRVILPSQLVAVAAGLLAMALVLGLAYWIIGRSHHPRMPGHGRISLTHP